jgi:hypothetical protein
LFVFRVDHVIENTLGKQQSGFVTLREAMAVGVLTGAATAKMNQIF